MTASCNINIATSCSRLAATRGMSSQAPQTRQKARKSSNEDKRYYSHVSAAYPGHRQSIRRADRKAPRMSHPSIRDEHLPSYQPLRHHQQQSRPLAYDQERVMYNGLPASQYAVAGPSRHVEMMTRATFVTADQAQEAPAPHFDRLALMDETSEPRQYNLIIRQSPKHGQMCTLGSKNRRTLDPLPIIQLDIRDKDGEQDLVGQSNPFLVMQVHLIATHIDFRGRSHTLGGTTSPASESSTTSFDGKNLLPAPHDKFFAVQRLLEGKLVASAHTVWDRSAGGETSDGDSGDENRESTIDSTSSSNSKMIKSTFFFFSDLSIRMCGTYRLHFSLLRLGFSKADEQVSTALPSTAESGTIVAQCTSSPFHVVHSREFTGISESTPLAKSFASQGVHIPIRNETKWRARYRNSQEQPSQSPQLPTQSLPSISKD